MNWTTAKVGIVNITKSLSFPRVLVKWHAQARRDIDALAGRTALATSLNPI